MKNLNIINLILDNWISILFMYFLLVIIQLIWLYYECTFKNIVLFLSHKLIIITSLILYFLYNSSTVIFFYIFGVIALIKTVEEKYNEPFSLGLENIFLKDIIFIIGTVIIAFYLL